jgi:chromosome segregation ATPase
MSQFFKQLIDLGDQTSEEVTTRVADELSSCTREELLSHIGKLEAKHRKVREEFGQLQHDSLSLRSEYDAYKRKVDGWQRQMKEARAADRRMIDELRAAGTSGTIDEAFVKSTNESIQMLKERLRDAQEEVEKAYKRQREAEEGRVAAESSKRKELEDLAQKFDAFKERTKQSQEKYESQLAELRNSKHDSALQQLHAQLESSERQRQALQKRIDAMRAGGAEEQSASELTDISYQQELQHYQAQLMAATARESELQERLRMTEERLQRFQEDAQWDQLEGEKKIADFKVQTDMLKTKIAQLETRLEAKDEENRQNEKQFRRAQRDLEDALTAEKDRSSSVIREAESRIQDLANQLQLEKERVAQTTDLIGEAETVQKRAQEALEAQRRHYEKLLAEKDLANQQLFGIRQSLEQALQEAKEDSRHHIDVIDELRHELDQTVERVSELESQQLLAQRNLAAREDDVMAREKERQKLRSLLRQEEDNNARLRSTLSDVESQVVELELKLTRKDALISELESSKALIGGDLESARATTEELQNAIKQHEIRQQELSSRLQEQGLRNSDILRLREDQSARLRSYESRVAELEMELRAHREAQAQGDAPARVDVEGFSVAKTTAAFRKQFVHEALQVVRGQGKFLSWSNSKQIIAGCVLFFVVLSFLGGFSTSSQARDIGDAETVNILREKYGQSLTASTMCRETLNTLKKQLSEMCPCVARK